MVPDCEAYKKLLCGVFYFAHLVIAILNHGQPPQNLFNVGLTLIINLNLKTERKFSIEIKLTLSGSAK